MPQRCREATWSDFAGWRRKQKRPMGVNPSAFAICDASLLLLLLLLFSRRLGSEKRGRLRRDPVEQVARLHEAAGVRACAEDHDRDVLAAALEAQHGREAVTRLGDEPGLAGADVDIAFAQQVVR